jgi:putative endonuclease
LPVWAEYAVKPIIVAIEREKQIKGWSRKKKQDLIHSLNPEWNDLYRSLC